MKTGWINFREISEPNVGNIHTCYYMDYGVSPASKIAHCYNSFDTGTYKGLILGKDTILQAKTIDEIKKKVEIYFDT